MQSQTVCFMRQLKDKSLCIIVLALICNRQEWNLFYFYDEEKSELGWLWEEKAWPWQPFPQGVSRGAPSSLPSGGPASGPEDRTSDFQGEVKDTQLERWGYPGQSWGWVMVRRLLWLCRSPCCCLSLPWLEYCVTQILRIPEGQHLLNWFGMMGGYDKFYNCRRRALHSGWNRERDWGRGADGTAGSSSGCWHACLMLHPRPPSSRSTSGHEATQSQSSSRRQVGLFRSLGQGFPTCSTMVIQGSQHSWNFKIWW